MNTTRFDVYLKRSKLSGKLKHSGTVVNTFLAAVRQRHRIWRYTDIMRPNKLRQLLNDGQPSVATHVHSTWPSIIEVLGHTGMFDYVEFVAEYAPFDL